MEIGVIIQIYFFTTPSHFLSHYYRYFFAATFNMLLLSRNTKKSERLLLIVKCTSFEPIQCHTMAHCTHRNSTKNLFGGLRSLQLTLRNIELKVSQPLQIMMESSPNVGQKAKNDTASHQQWLPFVCVLQKYTSNPELQC